MMLRHFMAQIGSSWIAASLRSFDGLGVPMSAVPLTHMGTWIASCNDSMASGKMLIACRRSVSVALYRWAAAIAVIVLASMFVATADPVRAQAAPRTVAGVIVNGTADGGDLGGLTVTFHQVHVDGQNGVDVVTDATGSFSFDDVEYDADAGYGLSVLYEGAAYGLDVDLTEGSPEPVTITVYEASQDDSIITVVSASLLLAGIDATTRTISALEILAIDNQSDRAYVPGEEPTQLLRFGLPPGVTGLEVDAGIAGADVARVDQGFALMASVPPGEYPLMFAYSFPYESSNSVIEKTYRYGADNVRMLAPFGMVSISSDELGASSSITLGERQYNLIEADDFARGATVTLRMTDLPMTSVGSASSLSELESGTKTGIRFEYAPPVALGVGMVALLAYAVFWRGRSVEPRPVRISSEETAQEREVVHRMIEDLEGRHAAGEISQDEFRRRIGSLNKRLARLR